MNQLPALVVSQNHRYLATSDGAPFFYLGDTVWELFHRYSIAEAETYLVDRAAKGFTVLQAVALAEFEGLTVPNPQGHLPLHDLDPTRPNEAYFRDVDRILARANQLGMYVGLLPTWGDKWNQKWGAGPEIFTPENAKTYAQFLGDRYGESGVIWILGGDRPIESETHRQILEAMASGLRSSAAKNQLITFHPMGSRGSSENFHEAEWLDFNMWQSGHDRNCENHKLITSDYARLPVKPTLDAEPGYEDHPAGFKFENGYLDHYDNRKALYWALFAGAFGHTYGCHDIWQKLVAGGHAVSWARTEWRVALQFPGASQMQFGRKLIESRPYFSRIPGQELIVGDAGEGARHCAATRDESGSFAFVYVPYPTSVSVDLERLSGASLVASWFDPRNGTSSLIGQFERTGTRTFEAPTGGPDWVLVLDDADQKYGRPGAFWHPDKDRL